jgi:FKBP-type peptidyl-prolyl cis-trans isomerase
VKKTYIILLAILAIGFASCSKSDSNNNITSISVAQEASIDDGLIKSYISSHNLDSVKKDTSGVYYKIIKPGTGPYPTVNSVVNVNYQGSLLNGNVFAPEANVDASLSNFIAGWQIGVPFINAGGTILLIIPSRYAYGNSSPAASVPANSVLVFTISLASFVK